MTDPQRSQPSGADEPAPVVRRRRKGIYVLPNLFTLAALFGGFYGIVMAMNGRFDLATTGIFAAMVLDSLDGRVARMTGTQSAFGEQMDSLADMVSFGAAPALLRMNGRCACWAAGAGSPPSSTAPARRCGWRASTSTPRWSTSAFSRACPRRPRPRWWRASSG